VDTGTFVFEAFTMAKTRVPYPPEFRRPMVELVQAGRTPEELAEEFEPTARSIRNWVAQRARNAGRGDGGLTTPEREELNRLRRDNRQLRLEREILSNVCSGLDLGGECQDSCRLDYVMTPPIDEVAAVAA
jgi:transposase